MDPIANMLTIIRNAQAVKKETVKVPYSNIKFNLAKIMEASELVEGVEKKGSKVKPVIIVTLKYKENGSPAITSLSRVSKPGQRIYLGYRDIQNVKNGYGMSVISTPHGLLTGEQAKKKKVGGELIAEIW